MTTYQVITILIPHTDGADPGREREAALTALAAVTASCGTPASIALRSTSVTGGVKANQAGPGYPPPDPGVPTP